MMDQAKQVLNQYIPATQWAMNYLNNGVNDFATGFSGKPGDGAMSNSMFQQLGDATANATPAGEGASLIGQGAHALSASHALPLALGLVSKNGQFGSALRNASKGFNMPIHPDDVKEIAPALERILSADPSNAHYFINQLPQDHSIIAPIAEHYMPGVSKTYKNDPVNIAQALLNRIITDRQ